MSNSDKSWPASGAFPFMPFPIPGFGGSAAAASPAPLQPAASAVTSGMEMLTNLWSQLPGSSQVPGFLVPTVDLDELDKRLADLRAAESWVEVNLNMLRATIRGLEVQRHTIAALHSLSATPPEAPAPVRTPPPPPPPAAPPVAAPEPVAAEVPAASPDAPVAPANMAGDWLAYMQDQFSKVAQAALSATTSPQAARPVAKAAKKKASPARARKSSADG